MFLKKVTGIRNVGRFKAARVAGGMYERFTLIYGGNGRGKSTLCAILRSLQTNDPTPVMRRRTFQATSDPEIGLLLDSGQVRFANGAWSAANPDVHIFDHQFVAENVHGGDQIDVEHRRNFYRIVVGPAGVALAEEVDRLDQLATAKQGELATAKKVLEQHLPSGVRLDPFLKIAADPANADKIADAERRLRAVNDAGAIASRKLLSLPPLPVLPEGFVDLLGKTAEGVAADAAAQVQAQLARHHFDEHGEAWLSQGLDHAADGTCPFCEAPLAGNGLIDAYRGFFSKAYADHRKAVADMSRALNHALSGTAALRAEQGFTTAAADAEFWLDYSDHGYAPPAAAERIVAEVEALFVAAKALLAEKNNALLETVETSTAFITAAANWSATSAELASASARIDDANRLIQAVKNGSAAGDKADIEAELAGARAVEKRHSEPVMTLAAEYLQLTADKQTLVDAKDDKKKALDAYDASIFGAYEADINSYLTSFGAGFRLADCKKSYVGKAPQSIFCLRFDNSDIDVTKASADEPGFDTTMSAGDKNTFAFAFFLAQLKRDADLTRKLVIFDDPFTSLDDFRRAMTAKEIVRSGGRAAQTLVLSHDKFFLDTVHGLIRDAQCVTMQISSTATGSSIEPWDLEREVKEGYLLDHMRLQEFADGRSGEAREMRTVMRPLLEQYIRYRFPNQILEGKWLGDMLAIIRADPQHPMTPHYAELDDINAYTAPFHHDPNAPYVEDEVRSYVTRTVAIVGGC